MPGNGKGGGKPGDDGGDDGGVNQINGNKRKGDTIFGTDGADIIFGRGGDDTLWGLGGTDQLIGGDDNDTLFGGDDDDSLHGGDGDDELYGGAGSDNLQGGEGADIMDGGPGPGDSSVEVVGDHDVASFVEIAPTYDAVNDEYIGLTISPYAGADDFDYQTDQRDLIVRVEEIRGTNYNDTMIGSASADYYVGARGNDVIIGNGGSDTLYGSLDNDTIYAGSAVLDNQNNVTSSSSDSDSDTLVFLRYNTDGDDATADPGARGDGEDTVYDFDVGFGAAHDTIEFLSDESVLEHLTFAIDNGDTVITYASDSTIRLVGVLISDLSEIDIVETVDPGLFA
jgi:Ca2+-binding RTX toxin-like protein